MQTSLFLNFENRCLGYVDGATKKLPLLLVTGFLGAGKTTLLRYILNSKANLRLAVLVNEIAEIDIDGKLLNAKGTNAGLGICTKDLVNGCVCCSAKDDLKSAVREILERRDVVDYIVIETSGAADPRPVAASLQQLCRLDLVVTVVDASTAAEQMSVPLFLAQLLSADMILLNKCDIASEEQLSELESKIHSVTSAKILRCSHGKVPPTMLMDIRMQMDSSSLGNQAFLSHEGSQAKVSYIVGGQPHFHNKSSHDGFDGHSKHATTEAEVLQTVSLYSDSPLSLAGWQSFVADLAASSAPHKTIPGNEIAAVVRAKGIVWFVERRSSRYEFHLSGVGRVDVTQSGRWEQQPSAQMVIIGRGLDRSWLQAAWDRCVAAGNNETRTASILATLVSANADAFRRLVMSDETFELYDEGGSGVCGAAALSDCPSDASSSGDTYGARAAAAAAGDKSDGATPAGPGTLSHSVVTFGIRETPAMRLHGVYRADLNAELVSAVNARRAGVILTPFCHDSSTLSDHLPSLYGGGGGCGGPRWLSAQYAVPVALDAKEEEAAAAAAADAAATAAEFSAGAAHGMEEAWEVIREAGRAVVSAKAISACRCGF